MTALSIDFGTTNTAAAVSTDDGRITEVRLSSSSSLMPSAVFVDESEIVVGAAAVNLALSDPSAFEANPKSRLAETDLALGGTRDPIDLAAAVLRHVVEQAARVTGTAFDDVVLSHPDGWTNHLTSLLHLAAQRAGLNADTISMITEAQAAAEYYSHATDLAAGQRPCVFDFGAGTCDVAVLHQARPGTYVVAASGGLVDLGGNDFDAMVFDWAIDQARLRWPDAVPDPLPTHLRLNLVDRARSAKETLSEASRAQIAIGGEHTLQITRAEFEATARTAIERSIKLARKVISSANAHSSGAVTSIYLVGGSSQIPMLHRELEKLAPVATLGDPKTVVVFGALHAIRTGAEARTTVVDRPRFDHRTEVIPKSKSVSTPDSARPQRNPIARVVIPQASGALSMVHPAVSPGTFITVGQAIARAMNRNVPVVLRSPLAGTVHWATAALTATSPPGTALVTVEPGRDSSGALPDVLEAVVGPAPDSPWRGSAHPRPPDSGPFSLGRRGPTQCGFDAGSNSTPNPVAGINFDPRARVHQERIVSPTPSADVGAEWWLPLAGPRATPLRWWATVGLIVVLYVGLMFALPTAQSSFTQGITAEKVAPFIGFTAWTFLIRFPIVAMSRNRSAVARAFALSSASGLAATIALIGYWFSDLAADDKLFGSLDKPAQILLDAVTITLFAAAWAAARQLPQLLVSTAVSFAISLPIAYLVTLIPVPVDGLAAAVVKVCIATILQVLVAIAAIAGTARATARTPN